MVQKPMSKRASSDSAQGGATKRQCGVDGKAVHTNKTKLFDLLKAVLRTEGVVALTYGLLLGPDETAVYEPTWSVHTGTAMAQFTYGRGVTASYKDLRQKPSPVVQQPTPHLSCDFTGYGSRVVVDSGPIDVDLSRTDECHDTWVHVHDQSGRGIVIFPPRYDLTHEPPDSDFGGYVVCGYDSPRTFGVQSWDIRLTIRFLRLKRITVTFDMSVPLAKSPRPAAAAAAAAAAPAAATT